MFSTFRFRVALAFGLLALALVVALSLILGSSASGAVTRDQSDALATLARSTSIALAEGLSERMREVELLAASPPAGDPAADAASTWKGSLQRVQTTRPQYSWIGFADPSGKVLVAAGDLLLGQSVAKRPWFIEGLKGPYTGDVHEALLLAKLLPPSASGEPLRFVDFAAPVNDGQGRPLGVLGVHATWDWARSVVESLQSQTQRNKGVEVFILDRKGVVIHHPAGPAVEDKLAPVQLLPAQGAADLRWGDGRNYLTAASRMPARSPITDLGWTVVVRQPLNEALATAREASKAALIVGGAAALVAVALAWLLAGALARPLSRIAEAAKRVEGGDLQAEIPTLVEARELSELSGALRGMKESLVRREEALARANAELEQRVAQRTLELERANIELETLARKDALTGLFNRRAADDRIVEEIARHRRNQKNLTLMLIDIDHFKSINDRYGHAVGDKVLQQVAQRLSDACRGTDFVARFGGEEFLVLMPETSQVGAAVAAEKLRHAASRPMPEIEGVTLSIGVVVPADRCFDAAAALKIADDALYEAKSTGRDRVVVRAAPTR